MAVEEPKQESKGETLAETQAKLEALERQTVGGAFSRTPKQDLLDATKLEKANPEKYYRYGRKDVDKMASHRGGSGLTIVSEDEARKAGVNREVGDLMLMEGSMDAHHSRVASREKENERRLEAHKGEMERVAEGVSRELRDKHGLDISVDRILDRG